MMQQLELLQQRVARQSPAEQFVFDVIRTLAQFAALGDAHRWATAEKILDALGIPVNETTKKKLRDAASAEVERIVSGDRGYCLLRHATIAEAAHSYRRRFAMGADNIHKAIKQRNAAHRALHESKEAA